MKFGPYPAIVVSIYDGDTVTLDIDLGFGIWYRNAKARFFGINAPELRTPEGIVARDYLKTLIKSGDKLKVASYGWDKYGGRFDAELVTEAGLNVNQDMLNSGHAKIFLPQ